MLSICSTVRIGRSDRGTQLTLLNIKVFRSPNVIVKKFIVVPFKRNRPVVPEEIRGASTGMSAEKIGLAMSARLVGVGAYSIKVDGETGDMSSPRLLASFGELGGLTQD